MGFSLIYTAAAVLPTSRLLALRSWNRLPLGNKFDDIRMKDFWSLLLILNLQISFEINDFAFGKKENPAC